MICVLSTVVWGHHMFVSGMNPYLGRVFSMATFMVSIPSAVFFLNWLGTLYGGSIRLTTPMLFSLSVIFVFGLGGLTGLFNGSQGLDIYLHDSYFVVGHFHFTMAASVFLGGLGATYFWFPKMFGRKLNEPLGKVHWLLSTVAITVVFMGMFKIGAAGHMRRVANPMVYDFLQSQRGTNIVISMAAFTAGLSQGLFILNLVWSYFAGKPAGDNPWGATTLEWSVSSPPPAHNFDEIPTVHCGPCEYSNPRVPDRDWLGQWEPLPEAGKAGE
jgi:cytochrome c oxidase subunit 1